MPTRNQKEHQQKAKFSKMNINEKTSRNTTKKQNKKVLQHQAEKNAVIQPKIILYYKKYIPH